jgi:ubiquinone/menaquinone biosynthesis C-methylase UbiE
MKVTSEGKSPNQCQKPSGWLGRLVVWNMNSRHSKLTDWGLSYVSIKPRDTILDVGCGGGKTVSKLAGIANQGRVYGLDYSDVSVAMARRRNAGWIDKGRVEIREGTVSELPFANEMFEFVTAVETHFWWPDLTVGLREVLRVLKTGGTVVLVAEVYKGATTKTAKLVEQYAPKTGIKLLTVEGRVGPGNFTPSRSQIRT